MIRGSGDPAAAGTGPAAPAFRDRRKPVASGHLAGASPARARPDETAEAQPAMDSAVGLWGMLRRLSDARHDLRTDCSWRAGLP